MCDQVEPPSSERYTPPLSLFSTIAQTRWEFIGETVTPITPRIPFAKPSFELISIHVFPSSVLFHKAEPSPPLFKL